MAEFDSDRFIGRFMEKCSQNTSCPFCGGTDFTSTRDVAKIIVSEEVDNIQLNRAIPSGMIICKNCGHIEFFALGPIGYNNRGDSEHGNETNN